MVRKRGKKARQPVMQDFLASVKRDRLFQIVEISLKDLHEKYSINASEVLSLLERKQELMIPISIFTSRLGPLEALCKYLKEEQNLTLHRIALLLKRDDRTVWITYRNSIKKKINLEFGPSVLVPVSIFSNRNFSILESLVLHLRDARDFEVNQIAQMLARDSRNIHSIYAKAKTKQKTKKR